jgi:hypothetical protein
MGVAGENHGVGPRSAEFGGDLRLRLWPQLAHHPLPLAVGKPGGVLPALDLPGEAGVGPQVVAVRGHM